MSCYSAQGCGRIKFAWCSQEDIEDWNFTSVENTAGFYSVEPASRIVNAMAAQYAIIFWTVQGAYVVEYHGLPFIYTYSFLGQHARRSPASPRPATPAR